MNSPLSCAEALARVQQQGLPDQAATATLAEQVRAHSAIKPRSLYVLRSATLEGIADPLLVDSAAHGQAWQCNFGSYAPIEAQLANPEARASASTADALLLWLELSDINREAADDPLGSTDWIEAALARLHAALQGLRALSAKPIVLALPPASGLGLDGLNDDLQPERTGQRYDDFRRACFNAAEAISDCTCLDLDAVVREVGISRAYKARDWQLYRMPFTHEALRAAAHRLSRTLHAIALPRRKCLVLDCDNTLWGGVLGDLRIDGIGLAAEGSESGFHALQREALALARRGVILALCSKNDEPQVLDVLQRHPSLLLRPAVIAAHRINWQDKAQNLRELATELNIGLDSMVFVDDNPVECERVRSELPQVEVHQVPSKRSALPGFLMSIRSFDTVRTLASDHARAQQYQARKARQTLEQSAATPGDQQAFLAGLEIVCSIEPARGPALQRLIQMEGKTNQFNTRTRRFTEQQVNEILSRGGEAFVGTLADKFGDHGITIGAVVSLREGRAEIENLLMSCRVIGMGAELAMLAALAEWAKAQGCRALDATIEFSERNTPVRELFQRADFTPEAASGSHSRWSIDLLGSSVPWPDWIQQGTRDT